MAALSEPFIDILQSDVWYQSGEYGDNCIIISYIIKRLIRCEWPDTFEVLDLG